MPSLSKIIAWPKLDAWRANLAANQQPLVVTNGCFDLLHIGHITLLESARELGRTLLVGVTEDLAIRVLKGVDRPLIPESDRVRVLASLEAVSAVCLFPQVTAVEFLRKARPDIYVKGADYSIETINQDERRILEEMNAAIRFMPRIEGRSSSSILARMRQA